MEDTAILVYSKNDSKISVSPVHYVFFGGVMKIFIVSLTILIIGVFFATIAYAAGPWKGKVIDAETKKPIEGAVVLAVWDRNYRTPTGGSSYFYEAKEVLTDKDGRFEIPSYITINLLPLISYIEGPTFTIFKPGYGDFTWHRVSPPMELSLPAIEEFFLYETGTEGEIGWDYKTEKKIKVIFGIVELPPLKTREERLRSIPGHITEAIDKTPLLNKLIDEEDKALGLK